MYLYDIREDSTRRESAWEDVRDETGERRRPPRLPPRRYRLSYLVTAWTQRPEDEHRLLSALLRRFVRNAMLSPRCSTGTLAEPNLPVFIDVALPPSQDRSLADVWSALGGELKPSLDLVVTAPMVVGRTAPYGPPVLIGPSIGLAALSGPEEIVDGTVAGQAEADEPAGLAAARGVTPGERQGRRSGPEAPGPRPARGLSGVSWRRPRRRPAGRRRRRLRQRLPPLEAPPPAAELHRLTVAEASLAYLFARLALVEARVRAAVDRRRADDADPDDRFRGLYISDAQVDGLLAGPGGRWVPEDVDAATTAALAAMERDADAAERAGADLRLRRLARSFGLDPYDVELLLIALAPDLDPRFERLYGYLHDDVSRRRASIGLALELAARGESRRRAGRARLGRCGALVAGGLVIVEDPERPFLTRSLRVPDRVAAHLLGDDTPDPAIEPLRVDAVAAEIGDVDILARAIAGNVPLIYLRERPGSSGHSLARAALDRLGRPVVELDLARLAPGDEPRTIAAAASREAGLLAAGLVAGPIEPLVEQGPAAVRALAESRPGIVLVGSRAWDPAWSREPPLVLEAPVATVAERHEMWRVVAERRAAHRLRPGDRHARVPARAGPDPARRAGGPAGVGRGRPGR